MINWKRVRLARTSRLILGAAAVALMAPAVSAQGVDVCGSLENHFGPFDYRTSADKHAIVERFHFTSDVEQLRRGASTYIIGGDISYVLRVFPNHHRALNAMARLSVKEKTQKPRGSSYSVDCWFQRALRFRPDDMMVEMLYGMHLLRSGQAQAAIKHLEIARKSGLRDANLYYNLGLAYVQLKRYDEALDSAHVAYALGFPLPGLRNQLQRAGRWRADPDPAARRRPAAAATAESEAPQR